MRDEILLSVLGMILGDAGSSYLVVGILLLLLLVFCGTLWRRSSRLRREVDKLRTTLDSVGAPVLVTDAELAIVDANRAASSVLGLRRRGPRRSGLLERLAIEGDATPARIREDLARNGSTMFEASVLPQEGTPRYVRVRIQTMEVLGDRRTVALLEDITTERDLSAHYERFLDHLIRNVPVEVSILSPDGKYRYLSSSFLVDERQRSWLIGRTDFDYCRESGLHTEVALRRRAHRLEAVDRGESVFFEEEVVLDGEPRHLSWRYVPFMGEDEVLMVLGFGLDESELVHCRGQLRAARDESMKASKLKEALLQNVSHEIRTPLSSIIATAQMLKTEIDPGLRDFIENVEENGRRLSETLNGMLDLAGLQAENVSLRPMMLDMSDEVEDVVRTCRPTAERHGLFLEYTAAESEILIRADRDALARCVKSLVDNALKFTSEGGVVVDVSQREGFAYVRVMDTGVGIGRSRYDDVFEAFRQEEDGLDRSFEGTGLGLAVTERLVRFMGGEVRVHSRKGAGSSFVVRLPLVMPSLRKQSGYRPRVLIADPQRDAHRLITHMMNDLFVFDSIYRMSDLTDVPVNRRYDAALIDARLDESCTPADLRALLRTAQPTADTRLIFVDCDPSAGRRQELLEGGWEAYVEKPITKLSLLNALHVEMESSLAPR